MSLRPIKGRPGKFLDTGTGKVLDISDYREDDKFDTIVIGDLRDEDRKTAIHAYVHLLVRNSKLNLPIWLNGGFADPGAVRIPRRPRRLSSWVDPQPSERV